MECSKCGKEIDENDKFCTYCGNENKSEDEENVNKKGKWKKYIKDFFLSKTFIIYTIIFGLIIVAFLSDTNTDISLVGFLGIFCYITILFGLILPVWIVNKMSTNKINENQEINVESENKNINKEYSQKCNEGSKEVNNIINEEERKQIANKIIAFIIAAILFCSFMLYRQNENKKREILVDKRAMLNMIQEYSSDIITVDDFDVEEIEKNDVYIIYEVTVNQRNYYINGPFYVALVKNGGISTDYVLLNQNLYDLRSNL